MMRIAVALIKALIVAGLLFVVILTGYAIYILIDLFAHVIRDPNLGDVLAFLIMLFAVFVVTVLAIIFVWAMYNDLKNSSAVENERRNNGPVC